jgi:hypothetical protein
MGMIASYETEGRIYAKYILQNINDAKIGVLYQNDDLGRDYLRGLQDGLGDRAQSMIVKAVSYELTDRRICRAGGRLSLPGGIIRWLWFPLSRSGIRGTHFLSLCFLNQSIASLGHASTRRSIRGSSVKIGVTKGDVILSLLK